MFSRVVFKQDKKNGTERVYVLYFQAVTAKNAAIALKIVAIGQFTL